MIRLLRCPCAFRILSKWAAIWIAFGSLAYGQALNQDQEIEVHDLPALIARAHDPSDVLLTSLDIVLHDQEICCGKGSALQDSVLAADPSSLKDVASKLNGRHLLGDGRPIVVEATYTPGGAVSAGDLIRTIMNQGAALIEWNSRLYVVHGVVFQWMSNDTPESSGFPAAVVHKLLLWDARFSDSRRTVTINRDTDNLSKLQGLMFLEVKSQ